MPSTTECKNLHAKLLDIMDAVRYVQKDGKVEFGSTRYKYASESKITAVIREQLIKQKVVIFPVKTEYTKVGNLTHIHAEYKIVNAEDPEDYEIVPAEGDGADSQDKGSSKAQTNAYKYMLLRTFAIPTGDDPDQISSDELTDQFAKEEAERAAEEVRFRDKLLDLCGGDRTRIDKFVNAKWSGNKNFDSLNTADLLIVQEAIAKALAAERFPDTETPNIKIQKRSKDK